MRSRRLLRAGLGLAAACSRAPAPDAAPPAAVPRVIAHRGASGSRPEHTLAAYELAIDQGADYIEPDLVSTKDGVLVARHEARIDETTDVAERFPERRATKRIDGDTATGWFVDDLTLAELKTLRARERLPFRSHADDGRFEVPTFEEVLALVERKRRETGRAIGIEPETKSPSWFRARGLPIEEKLVDALRRHGLDARAAPVFIQSFEVGNLERLRAASRVRLVQLVDAAGGPADRLGVTYASMVTPEGLRAISRYADALGANKRLIVPATPDGRLGAPTTLVRDAHAAGLEVHAWTFRSDAAFLAREYGGDPAAEYRAFARLGVEALFSDFPGHAVAALRGARRAGGR